MAAYLVGHVKIKNETLWQEYVAGVQVSLSEFESKIIFRGKLASVLAGNHNYDLVVVIEFSDLATLDNWYQSESYQSIIPVRKEAADVVITSYET